MKVTTNLKNIDFAKIVMQKIEQKPTIVTDKILKDFTDETGLKPKIKVHMVRTAANKGDMHIEVLNGDEAYKQRVIDFIKSHK